MADNKFNDHLIHNIPMDHSRVYHMPKTVGSLEPQEVIELIRRAIQADPNMLPSVLHVDSLHARTGLSVGGTYSAFGDPRISAQAQLNNPQSIPNGGGYQRVTWDTLMSNQGFWSGSNWSLSGGASGNLVIPVPGFYLVTVEAQMAAAAGGTLRGLWIHNDDLSTRASEYPNPGAGNTVAMVETRIVHFSTPEVGLYVSVTQDSGGALNLTAANCTVISLGA